MTTGTRPLHTFQTGLAFAAMFLLCFAATSARAGTSAFDPLFSTVGKRPAGVPAEFVITPFGYFHPSCVSQLAEGNTLLADGRVQHSNGTIDAAPHCNYPHYTSGGTAVPADAKAGDVNPLVISGWLESVSATTTGAYSKITSAWSCHRLLPLTTVSFCISSPASRTSTTSSASFSRSCNGESELRAEAPTGPPQAGTAASVARRGTVP